MCEYGCASSGHDRACLGVCIVLFAIAYLLNLPPSPLSPLFRLVGAKICTTPTTLIVVIFIVTIIIIIILAINKD